MALTKEDARLRSDRAEVSKAFIRLHQREFDLFMLDCLDAKYGQNDYRDMMRRNWTS